MIRSVEYDPDQELLQIDFLNGGTYFYQSVPKSEYDALISAPSAERYFIAHIKDRYEFRQ